MRKLRQPEMIWLGRPLNRCPLSGEDLYAEEVELTLTGENLVLVDWVLGRCERSDRWYGLLIDLFEVLEEEGGAIDAVDGFLLDGDAAIAGVWLEPPGEVVPWAFVKERLGQLTASPPAGPPPSPEDVQALPQLSETWELGQCIAAWYLDEAGEHTASYAAIVLDPAAGIRHHDLKGGGPHEPQELVRLILEAAVRPNAGTPGRPLEVRVEDEALAHTLAEALAGVPITIHAAPTPTVNDALDEMQQTLRGEDDAPFFTEHDEKAVRAYFRAAGAFYRAHPWDRIDGEKYVAFRLGDTAWGYLSVMGQMGEELGLSYFEDWLQLCRFIHNQPTPWDYAMGVGEEKPFAAAGALEGLTLEPLHTLHPDDVDYLRRLGVKPPHKGLYPFMRRFTLEGLETPHLSLSEYEALLDALAQIIAKRRARLITSIKQTITVGQVPVTLRYPAKGNEAFEEQPPGSFRLVISGLDQESASRTHATRIEVDAPGDVRVDTVGYAIKRACGEAYWVTGFTSGEHALWSDGFGRGAPCPRVAHLAGLPDLAIEFISTPYPMQVMPRMGPEVSEIQVKLIES